MPLQTLNETQDHRQYHRDRLYADAVHLTSPKSLPRAPHPGHRVDRNHLHQPKLPQTTIIGQPRDLLQDTPSSGMARSSCIPKGSPVLNVCFFLPFPYPSEHAQLNMPLKASTWATNAPTHVIRAKNAGTSIQKHTRLLCCTPQKKTR